MEPIAVEVPVKLPPIPGPKPVAASVPKPEPKPEPKAEVKPEAPKPDPKPAAPKVVTPPPGKVRWAVTRKQMLVAAVAGCSLVAGVTAVRLMRPSKPELGDTPPVAQPFAAATSPAPPPAVSESPPPTPEPVRPSPRASADPPTNTGYNPTAATQPAKSGTYTPVVPTLPALPTATVERTTPPAEYVAAVGPTAPTAPVTAPLVSPNTAPLVPPVVAPVTPPLVSPNTAPLVLPVVPPVTPPLVPPVTPPLVPPVVAPVTAPLVPPVVAPVTPTTGSDPFRAAGTPGKIDPPGSPSNLVPPIGNGVTVPPVDVTPAGGLAIPQVGPNLVATSGQQPPAAPMIPNPNPTVPLVPPVTTAVPVVPPVVQPMNPAVPVVPPTNPVVPPTNPVIAPIGPSNPATPVVPPIVQPMNPVVPPVVQPMTPIQGSPVVPPIGTNPGVLPPAVGPATPALPGGQPIEYVKPAGTPEVRPVANERPAATSFDVDLYEPRAGDTYDSISREFYNDTRYAAALRAFNANKALQGGVQVEVPPMHVLRKRFPQLTGTTPVPASPPVVRPVGVTGAGGEWAAAGGADPGFRASTNSSYVVPPGGMTLKAVAKLTLGTDQRWADVWELNRQITDPGAVLPAGTEVRLPVGARVP
jgi:hypothetical protein